jgi:NADH:ubiquinone oxidoreductase subunit C
MITRLSEDKLTQDEILDYIEQWEKSEEYDNLVKYQSYFNVENTAIQESYDDKKLREKTPNNKIPTGYYESLPMNMAAYMFQDVEYEAADGATDIQPLLDVLEANRQDEKDMKAGISAIAFDRGIEYIYSVGDENTTEIKFSEMPMIEVTLIYNTDIEKTLFCAIWKRVVSIDVDKNEVTLIDVIYNDLIQTYTLTTGADGDTKTVLTSDKKLFFDSVPVAVYRGDILGNKPVMHSIIPYIDALDWLITGNANDIQKLTDAILVLTQELEKEDVKHLDEIGLLANVTKEDRAEYLIKDASPEFRIFCVKLLIDEIYTHAHCVNWNDREATGNVESARALKMRLYDQDNFSNMIEMAFVNGARDRLDHIIKLLSISKKMNPDVKIKITYNRTVPSDFESAMDAFKNADWYSNQTKVERTGGDWETEKVRLEEQNRGIAEENGSTEDLDI